MGRPSSPAPETIMPSSTLPSAGPSTTFERKVAASPIETHQAGAHHSTISPARPRTTNCTYAAKYIQQIIYAQTRKLQGLLGSR